MCNDTLTLRWEGERQLVSLSCGDVPVFAPDPKTSDGANSHCKASRPQSGLRNHTTRACAWHDLWISRVRAVVHGVCRECTPRSRNTQSRSRSSSAFRLASIEHRNIEPMRKQVGA